MLLLTPNLGEIMLIRLFFSYSEHIFNVLINPFILSEDLPAYLPSGPDSFRQVNVM